MIRVRKFSTSFFFLFQLGFCINLQRASNSIRIELTLPMTVTAILFLLSPFLGKIHIQIIAKMFILFLQFITLQLFSNRIAPFLGSAAATPKLRMLSLI